MYSSLNRSSSLFQFIYFFQFLFPFLATMKSSTRSWDQQDFHWSCQWSNFGFKFGHLTRLFDSTPFGPALDFRLHPLAIWGSTNAQVRLASSSRLIQDHRRPCLSMCPFVMWMGLSRFHSVSFIHYRRETFRVVTSRLHLLNLGAVCCLGYLTASLRSSGLLAKHACRILLSSFKLESIYF